MHQNCPGFAEPAASSCQRSPTSTLACSSRHNNDTIRDVEQVVGGFRAHLAIVECRHRRRARAEIGSDAIMRDRRSCCALPPICFEPFGPGEAVVRSAGHLEDVLHRVRGPDVGRVALDRFAPGALAAS
jgi:hypothetical protein